MTVLCAWYAGCPRKAQVRGYCRSHYTTMRRYHDLKPLTVEQRFWSNVRRRADDECWPWKDSPDTTHYGMISVESHATKAHRLAWQLLRGPIPDGLQVLHSCDNPPCCNPAHLFLGTPKINDADKRAKGRAPSCRGEQNGHAQLTWEDVEQIRMIYRGGGVSQRRLAHAYCMSSAAIQAILTERRWPVHSRSPQ